VQGGTSYAYGLGGGGIGTYKSNALIEHNLLYNNHSVEGTCSTSTGYGGGMYCSNSSSYSIITDNTIYHNTAEYGGGISLDQSPIEISDSRINDENEALVDGGGIYIMNSDAVVFNCFIEENSSENNGAGIYIDNGSSPTLYNIVINNNIASNDGGGIYISDYANPEINNCTIADNIATNGSGGGLYHTDNSSAKLTNDIIWGNTSYNSSYNHVYIASSSPVYSYCCSDYSVPVVSCSSCTYQNPEFIGSGDYNINFSSSCIDAGNNNVTYDEFDIAGNDRIQDYNDQIDIGAYEAQFAKATCGTYTSETNWTDHNTNGVDYYISCNITIDESTELNISEGTTIVFDEGIILDVYGDFTADGDDDNYITFTATDQDDGWGGIRFGNAGTTYNSAASFDHCNIEYVKKDYTPTPNSYNNPSYSGGIYFKNSNSASLEITNSNIRYNEVSSHGGGLYIDEASYLYIDNCNIHNNYAKVQGGGISIFGSFNSSLIQLNNIYNNEANMGGAGIWNSSDDILISGNEIFGNINYGNNPYNLIISNGNGGGIGSNAVGASIYENIIYNNYSLSGTYNGSGYGGGVIYMEMIHQVQLHVLIMKYIIMMQSMVED